jgi:hypothetical protein
MSIEDLVLAGMGLRRNAEPQGSAAAIGGRAHIVGWKQGQRVAVPLPTPSAPGYDAAMTRADRFREHVSPLGGTAGWPWDQRPPVGEGSLKQEYRRSTRR